MNYTTIEQSKKLVEFGLSLDTADMCYKSIEDDPFDLICKPYSEHKKYSAIIDYKCIPCWSVGALLEVMPKGIFLEDNDYIIDITPVGYITSEKPFDCTWQVSYFDSENEDDDYLVSKVDKTLIEAAYNMVVWLLENGYIKKDK